MLGSHIWSCNHPPLMVILVRWCKLPTWACCMARRSVPLVRMIYCGYISCRSARFQGTQSLKSGPYAFRVNGAVNSWIFLTMCGAPKHRRRSFDRLPCFSERTTTLPSRLGESIRVCVISSAHARWPDSHMMIVAPIGTVTDAIDADVLARGRGWVSPP